MVGGNLRLGWEIVFQGHMDMGNTVVDNGMSIVAIDMATGQDMWNIHSHGQSELVGSIFWYRYEINGNDMEVDEILARRY